MILTLTFLFILARIPTDSLNIDVYSTNTISKVRQFEIAFLKEIIHLYNANNKQKIKLSFFVNIPFDDIQELFIKPDVNQMSIGVCGLTIRKNSKWDYSYRTLPIHISVIKNKTNTEAIDPIKSYRIAYIPIDLYMKATVLLHKKLNHTLVKMENYYDMEMAVIKGDVDFYIGDSIDGWLSTKTDILFNIEDQLRYIGYMLPKGSKLKTMIDPIIEYYVHTKNFYKLLRNYFGNEFSEYYRKTIQSS